jgi:hypothetical protein
VADFGNGFSQYLRSCPAINGAFNAHPKSLFFVIF